MIPVSLQQRVHELIERHEASGMLPSRAGVAIAIVKNREVLVRATYGLRDRERELPVLSETMFEICSSTKGFTSTALAMASEAGHVDLERPLNASHDLLVLSDPHVTRQVTIADMLSHRTGLPANDLLWYLRSLHRDEVQSLIGHLDLIPGGFRQSFNYNNLVYGALGSLFPKLVGESWESFVTQRLLAPLQMTATSLRPADEHANVALPYVGVERVARAHTDAIVAAGGIRSSLDDMTRWLAFQVDGGRGPAGERLLSESSTAQMRSPHIVVEGANPLLFQGLEWLDKHISYGLGWFLSSTRGLKTVFHPGFIDGFSTLLLMVPDESLGVVVLTNVNLSPIPGQLAKVLLDEVLAPESRASEPVQVATRPTGIAGEYDHAAYGTVVVKPDGALEYNGRKWALSWTDEKSATFTVNVFGIDLPLTVKFEATEGNVDRLLIPFSLDPRVGAQVFTRRIRPPAA